jgi:hypothetical protein
MRKAAYIATVEAIEPIKDKDKIKYVKLENNGFRIIHNVETMPIAVGEKIAYIEYDVLIKPCAALEFLKSRCWSEKYQALKLSAMRMAGVISYGLIISLETARQINKEHAENGKSALLPNLLDAEDGTDLSDALCVAPIDDAEELNVRPDAGKFEKFLHKYLPFLWKAFYRRNAAIAFPSFAASKTEETRVENLQYIFGVSEGIKFQATLKIDGASLTAAIYRDKFYIASKGEGRYSKSLEKAIKELTPDNASRVAKGDRYVAVACKYSLAKAMSEYRSRYKYDFAVQGELAGEGIQGNKMKLKGNELFLFNFFNSETKSYHPDLLTDFHNKSGVPLVPSISLEGLSFKDTQALKEFANKQRYPNGAPAEGVVFRAIDEKGNYLPPQKGMHNCFSFKVISDVFVGKNL